MKKSDRQKVFDKYDGKCAYCGCELQKGWHIDHAIPIRRIYKTIPQGWIHKGTASERYEPSRTILVGCENPEMECFSNYLPSCASCNINKHQMDIEQFRLQIKGFMNHLNNVSTQYKLAKRFGLVTENDIEVKFYFETIKNQPQ